MAVMLAVPEWRLDRVVRELVAYPPAVPAIRRSRDNLAGAFEPATLAGLVERGASRFGLSLLGASDADDLALRLDELLDRPDFRWFVRLVRRAAEPAMLAETFDLDAAPRPEEQARLAALLGEDSTALFCEGLGYLSVALRAAQALLDEVGAQARGAASCPDPAGLLADPTVPVPVGRLLLAEYEGGAAGLALGLVLLSETAPALWLAQALSQKWRDGQWATVRLVASVAGDRVPLDVVPAAARLDLERLEQEQTATEEGFQALVAAAHASGEPVFALCPDAGDA